MPVEAVTDLERGSQYDLIIINHNTCLAQAQVWGLQGPKVFTSHGPIHPLEQAHGGADYYVAVSEEVRVVMAERNICEGCGHTHIPRHMDVIRQPIDLDLYRPQEKTRNILIMPKYAEAVEAAAQACEGMDYDIAHYKLNPVDNLHEEMGKYKVVITAGRGAVEAMACGCQVMIYNGPGRLDGWVTPENVGVMAQVNYSGRCFRVESDIETLRRGMLEVWPDEDLRPWVEENHDAAKVAARYLRYAQMEVSHAGEEAEESESCVEAVA